MSLNHDIVWLPDTDNNLDEDLNKKSNGGMIAAYSNGKILVMFDS